MTAITVRYTMSVSRTPPTTPNVSTPAAVGLATGGLVDEDEVVVVVVVVVVVEVEVEVVAVAVAAGAADLLAIAKNGNASFA